MAVRELTSDDWDELWPLVKGFGTDKTEAESHELYAELVDDSRWAAFVQPTYPTFEIEFPA